MTIRVRLFAILRQTAGVDAFSIDLPDGATVAQARDAVLERHPALLEHLGPSAFAVNREYAPLATELREGDELAFIPPVSGG